MKSYFKFLSRNKAYTFINIAGLVVSLMFIILMGDYAWDSTVSIRGTKMPTAST